VVAFDTQSRPLVTWDIPGFAAFNNQLVIHVETMLLQSQLNNRLLVSPGFYFGTNDLLVPFDDLMNITLAQQFYLPTSAAPDRNTAVEVLTVADLFNSKDYYIRLADKPDPPSITLFWQYVYVRWMIALSGRPSSLWSMLEYLKLRDDIYVSKEANRIIAQYNFEKEVIGVHLRGEEWEFNCNTKFSKWDPRGRIYSCYQGRYD